MPESFPHPMGGVRWGELCHSVKWGGGDMKAQLEKVSSGPVLTGNGTRVSWRSVNRPLMRFMTLHPWKVSMSPQFAFLSLKPTLPQPRHPKRET